tara:strand:+ start:2571 stop:2960 length:390 start_codon:yes stop_codon:yes gene_type:complete
MRATVSFDIEVDQVEPTMAILIAQEADTLRAAADIIDVNPGPRTMVLEEVTEALRLMHEASAQLEQYRSMLVSFERARFETLLPQDAPPRVAMQGDPPLAQQVESVTSFDNFIDSIGSEDDEHNLPEEG